MRLWHQDLINRLPRQQLLGQHRELCALRGNGWGRRHATVDYVFNYSPYKLFQFHQLVMNEMQIRGYHPDLRWLDSNYRGSSCAPYSDLKPVALTTPIYIEHDLAYLIVCRDNLKAKGIEIS